MPLRDAKPGPFNQVGESGEPTESDWIVIDDRRYKVCALPRKTPKFVVEWCYGGLIMSFVGLVVLLVATRNDSVWAARVYWQRKRWYNGLYHFVLQEDFEAEEDAKARAAELIESLKAGVIPVPAN